MLTLTACKKTVMDPPILPGEVKILVNNKETAKAIVSDEFDANTVIAIFTQIKNADNGEALVNPKDVNVAYKQNPSSSFWKPISPDTAIMFKPYSTLDMFAYSPKSNQTNITLTQQGDRAVVIDAITLQNKTADLINTDLLYAKATGVCKDMLTVNLAFKHLFTKITLRIKKSPNWSTAPTLVSAGVTGADLFDRASVKLFNGVSTYSKVASGDLTIKWEPTPEMPIVKLSSETTTSIELIVLPSQANDVKIVMQADQLKYEFKLPETTNFNPGKNLIFNIQLDAAPMVDMTITPTIENWIVSQTHEIVPA